MDLRKRFISKCIKSRDRELEQGDKLVMKAQRLEQLDRFEPAIRCYEQAKIMYQKAYAIAFFIGDKDCKAEAQNLIQQVDKQREDAITTDYYRGGVG